MFIVYPLVRLNCALFYGTVASKFWMLASTNHKLMTPLFSLIRLQKLRFEISKPYENANNNDVDYEAILISMIIRNLSLFFAAKKNGQMKKKKNKLC